MKLKALVVAIFILSISYLSFGNYKLKDVGNKSQAILDQKGEVIRYLLQDDLILSSYVSLKILPKELIELFILAEDKNFYTHSGIDFISSVRALKQNMNAKSIVSGASTIEQQLARMVNNYPRNITGKIRTVNDSIWMGLLNDKTQTLEMYLNHLPFGHNIKGVWEASNYFYGKEPNKLSLSEMATLAVLPRAPSRLLREKNRNDLMTKRNNLLKVYFEKNKELKYLESISLQEANEMIFKRYGLSSPHFIRFLLKHCDEDCRKKSTIETSLDLELQKEVQLITRTHIERLEDRGVGSASVIVLSNKTGEVLAYVGSHDFFNKEFGQNDGVLQLRQPGSTLKPFTYAYAFSNDHNPASILPDIETNFNVGSGIYKPKNYSSTFLGPVRASFSLGNSLNIPALYLVNYYGTDKILNYYKSFGFSFDKDNKHYGIGITLGNAETSLLELAVAYTSFANEGRYVPATPFKSKKDIEFKMTNMGPEVASLVTKILNDPSNREHSFGRNSYLDFPFEFASKTGTSTNYRDNWVVGYNQNFTVAVWSGNFNRKKMRNVTGITGAGPIFHDVVKEVHKRYGKSILNQDRDKYLVTRKICSLSGKLISSSCAHSITEHFIRGKAPVDKCDFHRVATIKSCFKKNDLVKKNIVVLPPIFTNWKKNHLDDFGNDCREGHEVVRDILSLENPYIEIKSPMDGSFFGIDPNIPLEYQKMALEINSEADVKEIKWFINEKLVGLADLKNHLYWKLEKGHKQLKAEIRLENGKVVSRSISFNVL